MKFPSLLLQNDREKIFSEGIRNWNYLYTRHKPSSDWNPDEDLPDFTKIKIDQSFNWCNFSIPIWTRFNNEKKYLSDYAVAGFKAKTIREEHLKSEMFDSKVIDIEHKPLSTNYSHCELFTFKKLSKTEKRKIRMTFRHKCIIPLKPNEKQAKLHIFIDIIVMYTRRLLSKNISLST